MSAITIPTQNARSTGLLLTSANLQAASAADTFDHDATHLILTNGDSSSHTATITIGQEASFNVVMVAGDTYIVGVGKGKHSGSPNPGGTVTYSAITSVIVGAFCAQ